MKKTWLMEVKKMWRMIIELTVSNTRVKSMTVACMVKTTYTYDCLFACVLCNFYESSFTYCIDVKEGQINIPIHFHVYNIKYRSMDGYGCSLSITFLLNNGD